MNQLNIQKKEREILFDVIKGFTIILVVLGHCIQFGSGSDFFKNELFYGELPFKIIYSFHMPLFMLISGYFFYFTIEKHNSLRYLFSNRTKKILIPIVAWNILFFFVYYRNFNSDSNNVVLYFFKSIFTNLWFLWAVFWSSLLVIIVKKIFNDNIYVYILGFFISFIIPDMLNLSLYKFMYPFFILGYLYNKNKEFLNKKLSVFKPEYLLVATAILYLLLMQWYNYNSYIYTSGHAIIGSHRTGYSLNANQVVSQLYNDLFRFLVGLIGSVFVILSIWFLLKTKVISRGVILTKLGVESLGIYIISGFILPILAMISMQFSLNYIYICIETVVVTLISYILIIPLKRIGLINKILFGGR